MLGHECLGCRLGIACYEVTHMVVIRGAYINYNGCFKTGFLSFVFKLLRWAGPSSKWSVFVF